MMQRMRWTWSSLLCLASCLSKPGAPMGDELARDEAGAAELVIDGGDAFWTIGGASGAIRGCAIEACEPRTLVAGELDPHALLVEGDEVLWAATNELRRTSRAATGAIPVVIGQDPAQVRAFRHVGPRLYWSSNAFYRCEYRPGGVCEGRSTMDPLGELTGPMTLDANGLFWVANAERLFGADVPEEDIQRTFPASGIFALAADASHVFALHTGGTDVLAWPLTAPDGTAPTRIATSAEPRALALDGRHLFVAGLAGRIVRVPLRPELGEPEELVAGLPGIDAIAVAGDRIYYLADGVLGWRAKP